jgi:hypothetical protein
MAGSRPDAPAARVAYQFGGSQLYWRGSDTRQQLESRAFMAQLNSSAADPDGRLPFDGPSVSLEMVFDVPCKLGGWFLAARSSGGVPSVDVSTSVDTATGLDGVWVLQQSGVAAQADGLSSLSPLYRTPQLLSVPGVRGVRFEMAFTGSDRVMSALHVYADTAGSVASQRLQIWDPSADVPAAGTLLDWGDAPRDSAAERKFRVKNCDAARTAVRVVAQAGVVPLDEVPSGPQLATQFLLSDDGVRFAPSLRLGDLAPASVSGVVWLRRVTPSDAALGAWSPYVAAVPFDW